MRFRLRPEASTEAECVSWSTAPPHPPRRALVCVPPQALPPIGAAAPREPATVLCAKKAQRRAEREAALWSPPEAPRAALIHLEVTARSHEHLECFKRFPEHFNTLHG